MRTGVGSNARDVGCMTENGAENLHDDDDDGDGRQ